MEKITKRHHHDIQLKSVRVVSLNSFISSDLNDDNTEVINVETSIGNFGEVLSDTKGKSFLKTKVEGTNEGSTIFEIEVVYEGLCESIERVDKKDHSKFYELKVGPIGFDSHVIRYLNILNTELCNAKISDDITVGCMTLKSKGSLKIRLKSNKVDFDRLELNGFAEVEKMLIQRLA